MALIDMAVWVKGSDYHSAPFTKCLEALGWTRGEGMMNALECFTALSNNAYYCPTLTVNQAGYLEMTWENGEFSLLVSLGDERDDITYLLTEEGKKHAPVEIDHDHAQTLVEYWAAFLSQGNTTDGNVSGNEGRKTKGKGRPHQPG
jgi:hypothetical protein